VPGLQQPQTGGEDLIFCLGVERRGLVPPVLRSQWRLKLEVKAPAVRRRILRYFLQDSHKIERPRKMEMSVEFAGGARVDARFGTFTVRTDQPRAGGGEESAPTPFELFLASLGTCAGIYVLNFCRKRGIDTSGVRLVQRTLTDPDGNTVERVELEIHLPPEFPDHYRAGVCRAAQLCKVKKHLETPPSFEVNAIVAEPAIP